MSQYLFEYWNDAGVTPPYILVVKINRSGQEFTVHDPQRENVVVFRSKDYVAVRHWLTEDEFEFVRQNQRFDQEFKDSV